MKKKLTLSVHDKLPTSDSNKGTTPSTKNLMGSDSDKSMDHLVINSTAFPGVKVGEIFRITQELPSSQSGEKKIAQTEGVLLKLSVVTTGKSAVDLSVSKMICEKFGFVSRRPVVIQKVEPENETIEFLEVSFINQYFSRSDMLKLKMSLSDNCVYVGQKIFYSCSKSSIQEIIHRGGKSVESGYISDSTKFIFRSKSAHMVILLQMSKEMWEMTDSGDVFFEIAVDGFLKTLIRKWTPDTNHSVSVVFFSRTYYHQSEDLQGHQGIQTDTDGKRYQDFYKVVLLDSKFSSEEQLIHLRRAFTSYPAFANCPLQRNTKQRQLIGSNSSASQGNILEAVNLALDELLLHQYSDRDLNSTGQLLIVVTPGTGVFEVSSNLSHITKLRLIQSGTGMDMVCMRKPPLHAVPLFKFKDRIENSWSLREEKLVYDIPHWIHISMFDQPNSFRKFEPSCFIDTSSIETAGEPYVPIHSVSSYYASLREASLENEINNTKLSPEEIQKSSPDVEKLILTIGSMESTNSEIRLGSSYDPQNDTASLQLLNRKLPQSKKKMGPNPFSNEYSLPKRSSSRRRWGHLFNPSGDSKYINLYPFPIPWKSLTQPASLPLTNDYFPTKELLTNYSEYVYSLVAPESILPELVAQRINYGFQLISSNKSRYRHEYYLGLGQHYHLISYDRNSSIQIKRYQRRQTKEAKKVTYTYTVAGTYSADSKTETKTIEHQLPLNYPWNSIDNLICEGEDEFIDSIKYWKIGFMIIPKKILSHTDMVLKHDNAESVYKERIAAFLKLANLLFGKLKDQFSVSVNEPFALAEKKEVEEMNPAIILKEFQNNNPDSISEQDFLGKNFKNCFQAQTFIEWYTGKSQELPEVAHQKAIDIGNKLIQENWIVSTSGKTVFEMGPSFYQIMKEATPQTTAKRKTLDKQFCFPFDRIKTDNEPDRMIVKHDSTYDPSQIFHIELNWLIAKATVVEDFVSSMITKAGVCNFEIIKIPITSISPFTSAVTIPLEEKYTFISSEPGPLSKFLSYFGFLDDLPHHFIHISGCATITPTSSGFKLTPITSVSQKHLQAFSVDLFISDLKYFCADPSLLESLVSPDSKLMPYRPGQFVQQLPTEEEEDPRKEEEAAFPILFKSYNSNDYDSD